MEITKVPPSARGFQPLLIWSPRFRHRVSSRSAEEKTAARTHPSVREGGKGVRTGFPRVQRKEEDGERKVPREGGTRYGEGYEEAGWRDGGRVRTGGGLKGSERLDKSNPLKVRPTLCLPMRLRISRLRVPDSLKEASRGREKRKATETQSERKRDARNKMTHC